MSLKDTGHGNRLYARGQHEWRSGSSHLLAGLSLTLIAGVMNGSFAVPMKYARRWSWENIWFGWSIFSLAALPLVVTSITVPHWGGIYSTSRSSILGIVFGFGLGWGVSQVLFGLGIARVGVAVGFAIVVGLASATGSLVPLLVLHAGRALTASGLGVIGAVTIIFAGVALCAWAGKKKEKYSNAPETAKSSGSRIGILLCMLSGVGGSMINLGLAFGQPLAEAARGHGVPSMNSANAVWLPVMLSGFLPNAFYCIYLLHAHRTWSKYGEREGFSHWVLAFAMAGLWFGSVEVYGIAADRLGSWGPILGWPVFMSSAIITASLWGLLTGEWKGASAGARRLMFAGVSLLVGAIFILGMSGRVE
jgi:L-rhamnose-H+ transport protein